MKSDQEIQSEALEIINSGKFSAAAWQRMHSATDIHNFIKDVWTFKSGQSWRVARRIAHLMFIEIDQTCEVA
jgi:hypothetical protein